MDFMKKKATDGKLDKFADKAADAAKAKVGEVLDEAALEEKAKGVAGDAAEKIGAVVDGAEDKALGFGKKLFG